MFNALRCLFCRGSPLTARKPSAQCPTINQLDRHADREVSRRLREGTRCDENPAGGADLLHGCGELADARDTDLIDKPVLALHQD